MTTDPGREQTDLSDDVARERAEHAAARLRQLGLRLLEQDERDGPDLSGLLGAVTAQSAREARAGRAVAGAGAAAGDRLVITEGALRGVVRDAADDLDDVLLARCSLTGELDDDGAPLGARLAVSVAWPSPLPDASTRLRASVSAALERHTGRTRGAVDIDVVDLHGLRATS